MSGESIYLVVIAVIAYLIGSLNSSIIISRIVSGKDIRESGSGNAGATNMLRTMGKKYAVLTLIIDIAKGAVAVAVAWLLSLLFHAPEYGRYIAAFFVVLGHCFPLFFKFKGGKGVATALGVALFMDWRVALIVLGVALIIMIVTRYVSLGSIVGAIVFGAIMVFKMIMDSTFSIQSVAAVLLLVALVIWRHHENIKRLTAGTEDKLFSKKNKKGKKA